MNLNNLRQNVVKQFYAATYLSVTGQRIAHCFQAESPDAAMMQAKAYAAGKEITLISVEPVDNNND